MTDYILTSAAEADLRRIIHYTRTQWGNEQVRRYMDALGQALIGIATGHGLYRSLKEIAPDLERLSKPLVLWS